MSRPVPDAVIATLERTALDLEAAGYHYEAYQVREIARLVKADRPHVDSGYDAPASGQLSEAR